MAWSIESIFLIDLNILSSRRHMHGPSHMQHLLTTCLTKYKLLHLSGYWKCNFYNTVCLSGFFLIKGQAVTLCSYSYFLDEGAAKLAGQGKRWTGRPPPVNPLQNSINHPGEREFVCVQVSLIKK